MPTSTKGVWNVDGLRRQTVEGLSMNGIAKVACVA